MKKHDAASLAKLSAKLMAAKKVNPYEKEGKELSAAVALFIARTGCSDFVLPDFLGRRTLAFGPPAFILEHVGE